MNYRLFLHQAQHWIVFVLLPAILVTGAAYVYSSHSPKVYQATTTLDVEPGPSTTTTAYTAGQSIAAYTAMINSVPEMRAIDVAMAKRYPGYQAGAHGIVATQPLSTQATTLITITTTDTIAARAAAAANSAARVFIQRVSTTESARFRADAQSLAAQVKTARADIQNVTNQINGYRGNAAGLHALKLALNAYQQTYSSLLGSLEQFNVQRDGTLPSISVISPASVQQTAPTPTHDALIAGFLALLVCAGALLGFRYLDDSFQPEELEEIMGAPILGTITRIPTKRGQLASALNPKSQVADAYRIIRTNLQFTTLDHPPRRIVVTSARPQEGKSTTASNLAQVYAEGGQVVTLVDADLRRPSQHRIFQQQLRPGLTNLLMQDQLNGHGTITNHQNLRLIAAGPLPPNPADLLGSERMSNLLTHVGGHANTVIIDSPPVLAVADAAILSTMADGVLVVIDPAKTKRRDVIRTREAIEAVGGRILGVVVNRVDRRGQSYYYYHYAYSQGEYYSQKDEPADSPAVTS